MRAIPTRTDPLTRATMPAITSTAAMIHKMVSVLPPPFAASIPRTASMSPPFILGNYRRRFRPLLLGGMHHSTGDLAEVLDNLGVFRAAPQDLVELYHRGCAGSPMPPLLDMQVDAEEDEGPQQH